MANEFFSKDPANAMEELKEALYNRRKNIQPYHEYHLDKESIRGPFTQGFDAACDGEYRFLTELLDKLERS